MKIAIPVKENHQIDEHFGHCAFYQIYTINDQNIVVDEQRMDSPQGCGCKSNIAQTFRESGVKIMLAGGIGNGAIQKLAEQGIEVVRNCRGDAKEQLIRYLAGEIVDGGIACSAHEHGHDCHNH